MSLGRVPLSERCLHLCIDMQRLFTEGSPWDTPWMKRVAPVVEQLVAAHPERTIFTRFIPLRSPEDGEGTWREYYRHWSNMTLAALPEGAIDLLPCLGRFVPPATVLDKGVYSPWLDPALDALLRRRQAETLIISGAETDMCVLGAIMGAVDRGYRVLLPADALCSSSDEMHDALLRLYQERYSHQVEVTTAEDILRRWA